MSTYIGNTPAQHIASPSGSALPATANTGDFYFHVPSNTLNVYNGTSWISGSGGGIDIVASLPGSGTHEGQLVYDETTETPYVWDATKWVPLSGSEFGPSLPSTGRHSGDTFFDTTSEVFYVWNGSSWNTMGDTGLVPTGASDPVGGVEGQLFYNTTADSLKVYNGSSWVVIASGVSQPVATGGTLPGTGSAGELFLRTSDDQLFVRAGGQWVNVMPGKIKSGSSDPGTGEVGELFYNTTSSTLKVYDGSAWTEISGSGGGATVSIGTPLPGSGTTGDLFYDTATEKLYIYDGTTWIASSDNGVEVLSSLPTPGTEGRLVFDQSTSSLYVDDGSTFINLSDFTIDAGTSFPSGPSVGQLFFNSNENVVYAYTGSTWIPIGQTSLNAPSAGGMVATTPSTSLSTIYTSPPTAGYKYLIKSVHVTNLGTNDETVDCLVSYPSGGNRYIAYELPMPANASVELLKKPKLIEPSEDVLVRASSNGSLNVIMSYVTLANPNYFGIGAGVASTLTTVYVAPSKTRIDSIDISNKTTADKTVTISWTNGSNANQGYFCYQMILPAHASVELCTHNFYLPASHKIRAECDTANDVDIHISGETS